MASAPADARRHGLEMWLTHELRHPHDSLLPVSGDASFRRYFRLSAGPRSWIAMDAPPEHERCDHFVAVAQAMGALGLNVPRVLAADLAQGYLLLSDLGGEHYLDTLTAQNADSLYGAALDALERLQSGGEAFADSLPDYDLPLLQREMTLFPDWLLYRHLQIPPRPELAALLENLFDVLAAAALEQPRVAVHRDYHSRNLMVLGEDTPGVLDFQDAVRGPITYDLVSLLKDCYIAWPRAQVERWALDYLHRPAIRALAGPVSEEGWLRWFDLMGLQRHLKASGIFARLWLRDGKRGYLKDIPRTVGYMVEVSGRYEELAALHGLLVEEVVPALQSKTA
jgi:N-acetylmuramate 1-kinase